MAAIVGTRTIEELLGQRGFVRVETPHYTTAGTATGPDPHNARGYDLRAYGVWVRDAHIGISIEETTIQKPDGATAHLMRRYVKGEVALVSNDGIDLYLVDGTLCRAELLDPNHENWEGLAAHNLLLKVGAALKGEEIFPDDKIRFFFRNQVYQQIDEQTLKAAASNSISYAQGRAQGNN